ncbi:MAG: WD40/YVTN/BNR-like repeat-containing protein, partial [Candidatus Eiseniibacteriota bacterium]
MSIRQDNTGRRLRYAPRPAVAPLALIMLSLAGAGLRPPGAAAGLAAPAVRESVPVESAWVNINPGGGGAFTSIGAGPGGMIVAGSDLSGAYRSFDRGRTWDVIGAFRGLAVAHVSAVAFDPRDAGLIYLGTEQGLYRSSDAGGRFERVIEDGYIGAIAAAPGDSLVLYAASHSRFDSGTAAIDVSRDRGVSW